MSTDRTGQTGQTGQTGMRDGKRKLAAIMFTDIVRYSALSHENEALALALLETHRALTRPVLQEFGGKEIKTIGDAFLVTFESAFAAVQCGIHILKLHSERNEKARDGQRIQLRIGIHLGDVIISDGDVYGDGVNIAARLQTLARPGTLCLSGSVFYQIDKKLEYPVTPLGTRKLKNIPNPVAVYAIRVAEQKVSKLRLWRIRRKLAFRFAATLTTAAVLGLGIKFIPFPPLTPHPVPRATEGVRLAVLPFQNISTSGADEYLSDGMTEELISNLSRLPQIRVVARSAVMQYKESHAPVAKIGQDLQVSAVVQGSVRKLGENLRISVQFIDVATQETRWSRDYDGSLKDVFKLQSTIGSEIARQFKGRTLASVISNPAGNGRSPASIVAVTEMNPVAQAMPNSEAYDLYLRGRFYLNKRTEDGLRKGLLELQNSVSRDSKFAPAYAALANAAGLQSFYGLIPPPEASKLVFKYADRALSLDPNSTEALMSLAEAKAYFNFDWEGAEQMFRRAIASNPAHPTAHQWFAEFLAYRQRADEAIAEISEALRLDPISLTVKSAAANVHYYVHKFGDAMQYGSNAMEMDPGFMISYYWYGKAAIESGKIEDGLRALEQAHALSQGAPMMKAALANAYGISGKREKAQQLAQELVDLSTKRYVSSYDLATAFAGLGETAKTLGYLKKALVERASQITVVKSDPVFAKFRGRLEYDTFVSQLPF